MKEKLLKLLEKWNNLKAKARQTSIEDHKNELHMRVAIKGGEFIAYRLCIKDLEGILNYESSIETGTLSANEAKEKVCVSGKSYSRCHIHADNLTGCLDCGNYE